MIVKNPEINSLFNRAPDFPGNKNGKHGGWHRFLFMKNGNEETYSGFFAYFFQTVSRYTGPLL